MDIRSMQGPLPASATELQWVCTTHVAGPYTFNPIKALRRLDNKGLGDKLESLFKSAVAVQYPNLPLADWNASLS